MGKRKLIALISAGVLGLGGAGFAGGVIGKNMDADTEALKDLLNSEQSLVQTLGDSTAYVVNNVDKVVIADDNKAYEILAEAVVMKKGSKEDVDINITGKVNNTEDINYCEKVNNALNDYKNDPTVEKLTKYIQHVTKMVKNSTDIKVEETKVEIVESKIPGGKIVDMALSSCLQDNGMLSEVYKNMYKECSEATIQDASQLSIQQVDVPKINNNKVEGKYKYEVVAYALVGDKVCSVKYTIEDEKQLTNDFLVSYVTAILKTKNAEISLVDPNDDTIETEIAKLLHGKDAVTKEELDTFKANYSSVKYTKDYTYQDLDISEIAFADAESKLADFENTLETGI